MSLYLCKLLIPKPTAVSDILANPFESRAFGIEVLQELKDIYRIDQELTRKHKNSSTLGILRIRKNPSITDSFYYLRAKVEGYKDEGSQTC